MKVKITSHKRKTAEEKGAIIVPIEVALETIFNKLDAIDAKNKRRGRRYDYTVELVEEEE